MTALPTDACCSLTADMALQRLHPTHSADLHQAVQEVICWRTWCAHTDRMHTSVIWWELEAASYFRWTFPLCCCKVGRLAHACTYNIRRAWCTFTQGTEMRIHQQIGQFQGDFT